MAMSSTKVKPLPPSLRKGQREARVREPTEQHGQAEEGHYLRQRDGDVHGLERPAGQHPDHEAEEHQGQQVVDHAARDDHPGHAGICEPQVLEGLQSDHHRGGGHGETDEHGTYRIQSERGRHAEADPERHDRSH